MPPKTKGKAKKATRAFSSAPVMKQTKKAAKHRWVPKISCSGPSANRK